jgi:hypothetical protein
MRPGTRWGYVFGDRAVASAMIDRRIVDHAKRHHPQRLQLPPQTNDGAGLEKTGNYGRITSAKVLTFQPAKWLTFDHR